MGKPPKRCPMCHAIIKWKKIDTSHKGLSAGKAAAGGIVGGIIAAPLLPIGLVAGMAIGKKKRAYACGKCGFQHEY